MAMGGFEIGSYRGSFLDSLANLFLVSFFWVLLVLILLAFYLNKRSLYHSSIFSLLERGRESGKEREAQGSKESQIGRAHV